MIERWWNRYLSGVVPRDASPQQIQETRLAFYAGASALFYGITKQLVSGAEESE